MTLAYCYRNGVLGFTDSACPDGALPVAKGNGKKWRQQVEVLCRLAYDGVRLLVPGVPEAENDTDALNAVYRFQAALEWALLPKKTRQKTSWADYISEHAQKA